MNRHAADTKSNSFRTNTNRGAYKRRRGRNPNNPQIFSLQWMRLWFIILVDGFLMTVSASRLTVYLHTLQLLYYFFSIPLRVGLYYNPYPSSAFSTAWSSDLQAATVLDGFPDVFGIIIFLTHAAYYYKLRRKTAVSEIEAVVEPVHPKRKGSAPPKKAPPVSVSIHKWPNSDYVAQLFDLEVLTPLDPRASVSARQLTHRDAFVVFLHLIAVFPFEYLCISDSLSSRNGMHLLRLIKYLNLYMVLQKVSANLLHALRRHSVIMFFQHRILRITLFQLAFGAICWIHYTGIIYIFIAHLECGVNMEHCNNDGDSWLYHDRLHAAGPGRKYLRAIYWATRTVITFGFSDTTPVSAIETAFVILTEFSGAFWSAFVIVTWAYLFSTTDQTAQSEEIFFARVRSYMEGVPIALQERVLYFLKQEHRYSRGLTEKTFLSLVTMEKLQSRFHHELKSTRLRILPCFAVETTGFLNELAAEMVFEAFAPLDWLFEYPETQQVMYIITFGRVAMLTIPKNWRKQDRKNTTKVYTCIAGDTVGAYSLFGQGLYRFVAFAETFVQALRLDHSALTRVVQACYPDPMVQKERMETVRQAAEITYNDFSLRRARQRHDLVVASKAKQEKRDGVRIGFKAQDSSQELSCYWEAKRRHIERTDWEWYHSQSTFRFYWQVARLAAYVFTAFEVPFTIIFYSNAVNFAAFPLQALKYVLCALVELFIVADIILRILYFEEALDPTEAMLEPQRSLLNLIRDCVLDIVSVLPIALFADLYMGIVAVGKASDSVRFFRIIRILRLGRMHSILTNVLRHVHSSRRQTLLGFLYVFLYCHALSCIWYVTGRYSIHRVALSPNIPILKRSQCLDHAQLYLNCSWTVMDGLEGSHSGVGSDYIRSLYFSISTLTTVAYGDIVAYTDAETFVCTLLIFFSGLICFGITGALAATAARVSAEARDLLFQDHLRTRFFSQTKVSRRLQSEIRHFYHIIRQQNEHLQTEKQLFSRLSRGLRADLSLRLFHEICTPSSPLLFPCLLPVLEDKSQVLMQLQASDFLMAIAARVQREIIFPNDHIVLAGEKAYKFYIICSGKVQALEPITRNLWQLMTEKMLIDLRYAHIEGGDQQEKYNRIDPPAVWSVDCIASSMTEVVSLKLSELVDVMKDFPQIRAVRMHHNMLLMQQARKERQCVSDNLARRKVQAIAGTLNENTFAFGVRSKNGRRSTRRSSAVFGKRSSMDNFSSPSLFTIMMQEVSWYFGRLTHICMRSRAARPSTLKVTNMEASMTHNAKSRAVNPVSASWQRQTDMEMNRSRWETLIALIVVYNMYIIVFRIVFVRTPSTAVMVLLTTIDYLFDAVFALDIYLKYNYFPPRSWLPGKSITKDEIRHYYKKSWLLIDVFASLPLYYIGSDFQLMNCLRIPRLLRSMEMLEMAQHLQSFLLTHVYTSRKAYSLLSLCKVMFIFIFCCHFGGCIFVAIADAENVRSGWMWRDIVLFPEGNGSIPTAEWLKTANVSKNKAYLRAFYWMLSSITVVNYGDVFASTLWESVWACIVCLFGLFVISKIEGEIVDFFTSIDRTFTTHQNNLEAFHDVARVRRVHSALSGKAERYLKLCYEIQQGLSAHELFNDLITPLRERIFMEMDGQLLTSVSLWKDILTLSQIQELAALFVIRLYLPEDIILYEQTVGKTLHVLKSGIANVVRNNTSTAFFVLHAGDIFGELSFFDPKSERLASVVAESVCEVLELDMNRWMIFARRIRNAQAVKDIENAVKKQKNAISEQKTEEVKKICQWRSSIAIMDHSPRIFALPTRSHSFSFEKKKNAEMQALRNPSGPPGPRRSLSFSMEDKNDKIKISTGQKMQELFAGSTFKKATARDSLTSADAKTKEIVKEIEIVQGVRSYRVLYFSFTDEVFIETSRFRYIWDCMKFLMTTYFTIAIPMRVAFSDDILYPNGMKNKHGVGALWVDFEHVVDVFFWIDIFLRLFFFRPVVRGVVVNDRRECMRLYWKSGFWLDVIGSTPFELLTKLPVQFFTDYHTLSVSIFRLETLVRCAELEMLWLRAEAFLFYHEGDQSNKNKKSNRYLLWIRTWQQTTISSGKVAFIALISSHWIACLWYLSSRVQYDAKPSIDSWLTTSYMLAPRADMADMESISFLVKYVRSLHYAIGSISAISYGDIAARNVTESLAQIFIIFLSLIFFGYITGHCRKILERQCYERIEYEMHVERLGPYAKLVGMSPSFVQSACEQLARSHQRISIDSLAITPAEQNQNPNESSANLTKSKVQNEEVAQESHGPASFMSATSTSFMSSVNTSTKLQRADLRSMFIPMNPKVHLKALDHLSSQMRTDIIIYMRRHLLAAAERRVIRSSALYSSSRSCPHPFDGFNTLVVRAILIRLHTEIYDKKEILFEQEGLGKCMYFIERGVVLLERDPTLHSSWYSQLESEEAGETEAKVLIRNVRCEGEFFGSPAILDDQPRDSTCSAITRCHVAVLRKQDYTEIAAEFPEHVPIFRRVWGYESAV